MKKLLGFGVSSAVSLALRALSLPLMSWLVSPTLLAEFALWQLALGLLTMVVGLGLGHSLQREFYELERGERFLLVLHMLQFALLPWLLLLGLAFVRPDWLALVPEGWLVLVILPAHLFLNWGSSYLRLLQVPSAYAQIQVGGRLVWLGLLALVFLLSSGGGFASLREVLWCWLAAELINLVWLVFLVRRDIFSAVRQRAYWWSAAWRARLRQMFRYARPLLLSESLYWGMGAVGALLLVRWQGLEQMSIYAMAVALGGAGGMVGQLFNTLWLPEIYRLHSGDGSLPWLPRRAQHIIWFALAMVTCGALASVVVWWVLPSHYAQVPYLVAATLLKPSLMALQRVTAIGIELQRQTWVSPIAMASGLTVQLLSAWWLIPNYSAAGAVVSLLLGSWVFWQLKTLASHYLWGSVGGWRVSLPIFFAVLMAVFVALRFG